VDLINQAPTKNIPLNPKKKKVGLMNQTPTKNQTPTLRNFILYMCLINQTHIFDPLNK